MESAKRENLEAQELKTKRETEYNQLRQESKTYLDEAKLKAEKEKERIILEAKTSAKSLMERGQKEIEAEKLKAQADLEEETLNLAALMAGKIIEKEVDPDKYQDLLVENLKRSEKS
jgi:F-type H+-transporting ATPase subunit b